MLAKFSFEFGYGKNDVIWRRQHKLKLQVGTAEAFDLMKIIKLISRNAQHTLFLQRSGDCVQKAACENPSGLMPPLRPWIRKQKVKSVNGRFRKEMAHSE